MILSPDNNFLRAHGPAASWRRPDLDSMADMRQSIQRVGTANMPHIETASMTA